jgi:hypothetical protein
MGEHGAESNLARQKITLMTKAVCKNAERRPHKADGGLMILDGRKAMVAIYNKIESK